MDRVDALVIGAGTVGMAVARAFALSGLDTVVVERHGGSARETSSRNSGVIHAGIHYPAGSLKAESCIEGRERLYRYCAARGVPHRKTQKIIVACTDDERAALAAVGDRARTNGVALRWLEGEDVRGLEPRVRVDAGLLSPETGIVDVHALTDAYAADFRAAGGAVAYRTTVVGLRALGDGWRVATVGADGQRAEVTATRVVNAAGLAADRMAERAGVDVDAAGWRLHYCKGDYFRIAPRLGRLADRLIYPLPNEAGLGVHITMDLGGGFRAGPDTEYVEALDYDVDAHKAPYFGRALRRYLPEIRDEDLTPDYAGVRPKRVPAGAPAADFVCAAHPDTPGMLHLVGIESPGITASLALAARAVRWARG